MDHDNLPPRRLNPRAVQRGRESFLAYQRQERRHMEHDYGKHRGQLLGDCSYCTEELTYQLHRLSSAWHGITDPPPGFRA